MKLLHELLEQLATLRPSAEGGFSALLDVVPPSTLRESFLVVISTRPINLMEEAERSARLSPASLRGLLGRVTLLDASKGELADLIKFGDQRSGLTPRRRLSMSGAEDDRDRDEDRAQAGSGEHAASGTDLGSAAFEGRGERI